MNSETLTQLGHEARGFSNPDEAVLERVANPQADVLYLARFTAPEFTTLCPVTGQPDFAHLVIDYRRPVVLGAEYELRAWCDGIDGRKVQLRAELCGDRDEVVAEASGLFITVDIEHFRP